MDETQPVPREEILTAINRLITRISEAGTPVTTYDQVRLRTYSNLLEHYQGMLAARS